MISRGSIDGDSNRMQKVRIKRESWRVNDVTHEEGGPVISFGPKDIDGVHTPHNDALVIQAKVANYEI